ncbi:uncharacterized protein LOC129593129 [Paramacrobiotus metropolitanus]|uniref:uncharacterized protein LOC129593129 n=1 Tax=Paramacrobiotus metropolitanus TaxID=2943436 RepID=UPI0024456F5B|nr:uncharacterized protein LOC129593129 [Paramacrobiotus metropolitanus]
MECLTSCRRMLSTRLTGNSTGIILLVAGALAVSGLWRYGFIVVYRSNCPRVTNATTHCEHRNHLNDSALDLCLNQTLAQSGKEKLWFHVSGDSRTRQIFLGVSVALSRIWSTAESISHVDPLCESARRDHCHMNVSIPGHRFSLSERWYPSVENERMQLELEALLALPDARLPDILIANSGAWLVHTCFRSKINDTHCAEKYRSMMSAVLPLLRRLAERTKVVWMPQNRMKRDWGPQKTDHGNDLLQHFNRYVYEELQDSKVVYWKAYNRIYDCFADTEDGIHVGPKSMPWMVNILLEYVCTDRFDNSFQCCY